MLTLGPMTSCSTATRTTGKLRSTAPPTLWQRPAWLRPSTAMASTPAKQSSTHSGNAIAIPHGTPESRHHVKRTGVRVPQFPKVQWHDGHTVHVLVTIAAQNDEHLDILRQLTHVLDREGVATELARASSAADVARLLSKPSLAPRLDADTLCVNFPARDPQELALAAAARLRQSGCVDNGFISAVASAQPQWLGKGLWLSSHAQGVNQPALGVATPADGTIEHGGHPVHALFCLAASGDAHRPLLEQLMAVLENGESDSFVGKNSAQLLAALAVKPPAPKPAACAF